MTKSDLQFTNPHLEKLDFRLNPKYNQDNENLYVNIETECFITPEASEANIKLHLKIGSLSENEEVKSGVYFYGIMAANFKWNNKIKNAETQLKVSGGSILLAYLRPIIATISMQAGLSPLHIPFINFNNNNVTDDNSIDINSKKQRC